MEQPQDIRQEVVDRALRRIESGHYDFPDLDREEVVAEGLLRDIEDETS